MKNSIIIFSIVTTALSLMAFGRINTDESITNQVVTSNNNCLATDKHITEDIKDKTYSDFFYDMSPRFSPIKKSDLDNAKSIVDFLPKDQTQPVVSYKSVSVIIIIDDRQTNIREIGYSDVLTDNQIKLLRSSEYSTNFMIRAEYLEMNKETRKLENRHFSTYLTIVPDIQAEYEGGKDAFLSYLRKNNKENTANLDEEKLQAAKLYYTVTSNGEVTNIKLDRTSGNKEIDKTMIDLITKAPGKWEPAKNSKGEKVDQELVISFGMVGC